MIRWSLIALAIWLLLITSESNATEIFGNFLQSLQNLLLATSGGIKFLAEFVTFAQSEVKDSTPINQEEYDFIVVGAGSAGAAIASRLSEIKKAKILLIEAGYVEHLVADIPIIAHYWQLDKSIHWNYKTEASNSSCLGTINNECTIPFGKVLGGTSTVNFMLAVRGNKKNYDRWAEETGDRDWSYDEMLKYFKKLEKFNSQTVEMDPEFHNFDGPVHVNDVRYRTPVSHAFVKAGAEIGFNSPIDYNGRSQTGFAYLQTNQINGERMSTNRAYLNPVRNRKNLVVSMNSHVDKILINPETKEAYGVEFTKFGRKIQAKARKEVILSAGAIGSPKILMLSGIGPAEHLRSFNINLLKDAPVGENLMDHIAYSGLSFIINTTDTLAELDLLNPSNPALSTYLTKREGPFTVPATVEALGFVNVDDRSPNSEMPNAELVLIAVHLGSVPSLHKAFKMKEDYFEKSFANTTNKYGFTIWPILIQPKSRGKVLLRSANPKAQPRIIANYFDHPDDVRVGVKAIRMAIEMSKTDALRKFGSKLHEFIVPGCEKFQYDSDNYWECAYRTFTMSVWHHAGTCKMGKENDPSAVVNSKLQVKGIKNLRVADASIMPMIPAAHLNLPAIAVGEKLSDMLKADWGYVF